MVRAHALTVALATLMAAAPLAAGDLVSPLAVLPAAGIVAPPGTTVRLYSAPLLLAHAFFDGRVTSAGALSADPSVQKLVTLDASGAAATRAVSAVLGGTSARAGMAMGADVLAVFDYYPAAGASHEGLFRIAPDGSFSPWPLSHAHGGANSLVPAGPRALFLPAAVPGEIRVPPGIVATALRANYTFGRVGSLFFEPDGHLCVLSSSPHRRMLARIAPGGESAVIAESDVLVGTNYRAAAPHGDGYVVAVDYAPAAGNGLGGIYRMARDGTHDQWPLAAGHSGISDLISAPQGGYYFTDFENDNLWYIAVPGEAERAMLAAPPVALMSVAAAPDGELATVNWQPGEWWSNGGVNAVYRIAGDTAVLAAQAPAGSLLYAIAASPGGAFGTAFYVSDIQGGRILRLETDGALTPVITGLPSPGRLRFDPATGALVVVCDGQYLVWFGADAQPFVAPPVEPGFRGLFFSDFENDNVWFVPTEGSREIPLLDQDVPPGLRALAYDDVDHMLYALNEQGGWPFGGEDALYAVKPNGTALKVLDGRYAGVAMGQGGPFARALHLSDLAGGSVVRLDDGGIVSVVSGLPRPGPLAFDPLSGNLLVLCDDGRQVAWIGAGLPAAAAGEPGAVGPFFIPGEQAAADLLGCDLQRGVVTLELPDTRPTTAYAASKVSFAGDFDIAVRIRMTPRQLTAGQNRSAVVYVMSDVAGQRDLRMAYAGILQKTVGYAATGGGYAAYTDMRLGGGWGRFRSRPLSGDPDAQFRIARRAGIISTYWLAAGEWERLSATAEGFDDRVRVYLQIDTAWEAALGVAHAATFQVPDFWAGNETAIAAAPTSAPQRPVLLPNYPNPFNPSTTIGYVLPGPGPVSLQVYAVDGQLVRELVAAAEGAGYHEAHWDGRDQAGEPVGSGVYLCSLRAGPFRAVHKMALMK